MVDNVPVLGMVPCPSPAVSPRGPSAGWTNSIPALGQTSTELPGLQFVAVQQMLNIGFEVQLRRIEATVRREFDLVCRRNAGGAGRTRRTQIPQGTCSPCGTLATPQQSRRSLSPRNPTLGATATVEGPAWAPCFDSSCNISQSSFDFSVTKISEMGDTWSLPDVQCVPRSTTFVHHGRQQPPTMLGPATSPRLVRPVLPPSSPRPEETSGTDLSPRTLAPPLPPPPPPHTPAEEPTLSEVSKRPSMESPMCAPAASGNEGGNCRELEEGAGDTVRPVGCVAEVTKAPRPPMSFACSHSDAIHNIQGCDENSGALHDCEHVSTATAHSGAVPPPPSHRNSITCLIKNSIPTALEQQSPMGEAWRAIGIHEFPTAKKLRLTLNTKTRHELFCNFVNSGVFTGFSTVVILCNTCYMGYETNNQIRGEFSRIQEGVSSPEPNIWPEIVFTAFFVVELTMRVLAERREFLCGRDIFWNVVDTLLIVSASLELALSMGGARIGFNFSVWRICRVFRLARLLKIIRKIQFLDSLSTMVYGILNCFAPLGWALVILLLVEYTFAVFLMSCIVNYLEGKAPGDDAVLVSMLDSGYGSLYKVMVLLFEGATGGADWGDLSEPLKQVSEAYYIMFALYIVFVTLGALNILTGFFVDGTMQANASTLEERAKEALTRKNMLLELLRQVFHMLDVNQSGIIRFRDLEAHFAEEHVQQLMLALELDLDEVADLFQMLDYENSGEIAIDNFTSCCLMVCGGSKNMDICSVFLQNKKVMQGLSELSEFIYSQGCGSGCMAAGPLQMRVAPEGAAPADVSMR
eukprot:NODE_817_length_2749_cov_8.062166.p1 GENE.NODE_817_length_2749_cov_8.062166~~NODE_817_length_2749_cov_8.062166.p1  ORF type:complete len:806 (+),score=136.61 NODE_817_length_2749_cov_8.062166:120-2537(+)